VSKELSFVADVASNERGVDLDALRARADALPREQLDAAASLILIRFLSVLGNLTADVLTPALHHELAKAASRNVENPRGEHS
jgi:hypothetical protein